MKSALLLGAMLAGAAVCSAQQSGEALDPAKAAALDQAADQFTERLHQSLDIGAQSEMFAPEFAALNREYPGEFLPFATPRVSLALLKSTDDATIRRKLLADWNLYYWTSLLRITNTAQKDPARKLPPEFIKAARKSHYLRCFVGEGSITLTSPEELAGFLKEADQLGAILKKNLQPDLTTSDPFKNATAQLRSSFGPPRSVPLTMGFERVYTLARDTINLVMIEKDNQFKVVGMAPLSNQAGPAE